MKTYLLANLSTTDEFSKDFFIKHVSHIRKTHKIIFLVAKNSWANDFLKDCEEDKIVLDIKSDSNFYSFTKMIPIYKKIKNKKIDIICSYDSFSMKALSYYLWRKKFVAFVWNVTEKLDKSPFLIKSFLIKRLDKVVFQLKENESKIHSLLNIPKMKLQCIGLGEDHITKEEDPNSRIIFGIELDSLDLDENNIESILQNLEYIKDKLGLSPIYHFFWKSKKNTDLYLKYCQLFKSYNVDEYVIFGSREEFCSDKSEGRRVLLTFRIKESINHSLKMAIFNEIPVVYTRNSSNVSLVQGISSRIGESMAPSDLREMREAIELIVVNYEKYRRAYFKIPQKRWSENTQGYMEKTFDEVCLIAFKKRQRIGRKRL